VQAGVDIKIITGDTSKTAIEIARQIGLDIKEENHITGEDFAKTPDDALNLTQLKIISRARPLDKQRLVHLLQQQGNIVAVTGDGTNDAPALKAAQVGLSMGSGSFVAKQASDITILDDSFSSIEKAILWGRSLYQNIQRFILFQLTINFAACLIVLLGALFGMQSPLTVTQMLWVNLIMDTFAAIALASLSPNIQVMTQKPRSINEHILSPAMKANIAITGSIFVVVLMVLLQYFNHFEVTSLSQFSISNALSSIFMGVTGTLSTYELSVFFSVFVLLQFWNLFNAKSFLTGKSSFHHIAENPAFIVIAAIILIGQIVIISIGGDVFKVTALSFSDWLIIIAATSLVLVIKEAMIAIAKR
jgi:Ca2+-transporting ATPase